MLRIPLLLATARRVRGIERAISLAPAPEADLERLGGMRAAPGEAKSKFQGAPLLPAGQRPLLLECASVRDALRLLDRLSQAGCSQEGFMQRFSLRRELGCGSFGSVFVADDAWTGQQVAVKLFTKLTHHRHVHPLREASLLRWSRGSALFPSFKSVWALSAEEVRRLGVLLGRKMQQQAGAAGFALVAELVQGTELFDLLAWGPVSEDIARLIAQKLLQGIAKLHSIGVMHRDIKPENVMVPEEGEDVKLLDFGLACAEWDREACTARAGSVGYTAPEVFRRDGAPQTCKVDCFGVGALLYSCLTGRGPFRGRTLRETLVRNAKYHVDPDGLALLPRGARDLVVRLMRADLEQRPTAQECLRHPWLADQAILGESALSAESLPSVLSEEEISEAESRSATPSSGPRGSTSSSASDDDAERPSSDDVEYPGGGSSAPKSTDDSSDLRTASATPAAEWRTGAPHGFGASESSPMAQEGQSAGPSDSFCGNIRAAGVRCLAHGVRRLAHGVRFLQPRR